MADYITGSAASAGGYGAKSVTVTGLSGETDVVVWATTATDTASPAVPTCDGNAMTQVGGDVTAFFGVTLRLFRYIAGNPSGNLSVVADAADSATALAAWATNSTNQTTPAGTAVTSTAGATGTDFDLSPSADGASDYVMMAAHIFDTAAPDGSLDSFADDVSVNSGGYLNGVGRASTGSGSQTLGFTTTSGDSAGGIAVAALNSGGGGTSSTGEFTTNSFTADFTVSNIATVVNRTLEAVTNAFIFEGTASNLNQVVQRTAEFVTNTFSVAADTIDVYINAASEMVTSAFSWAGDVSSSITTLVTGAFEWGAQTSADVSTVLQRIATATLEYGAIFLGTASGTPAAVVSSATDLIRTGAAYVRAGASYVKGLIRDVTRRY